MDDGALPSVSVSGHHQITFGRDSLSRVSVIELKYIEPGSIVLLHSSISRTLRTAKGTPNELIAALLKRLGPEGTLLLPLFNFDFTKGTTFDIRTTPSQMGALTEAGRAWPGAVRTGHPIYSFAAIGSRAEEFADVDNESGYGADSPFAMLRSMGGEIAVLDLPDQNSMTFYHHVEEMSADAGQLLKNGLLRKAT
jgi:aminoglycoside 3-N-acetyltransferase